MIKGPFDIRRKFILVYKKGGLVVFLVALIHTNKIVTTKAPNIAQISKKRCQEAPRQDLAFRHNKKTSMTIHKYPRKKLLLLSSLLVVFFLTSCQKQPNLLFGNSYTNDNSGGNVVVVDTSTVLLSTVYTDSTSTNGTGYLMVGSYNDSYLGNVTSRAFWQVAPPSSLPAISPINNRYDSIGLILFFKKANPWYGDTTYSQTYVVNQVDSLYQLATFQRGFFSNSNLPVDPNELGRTNPLFIFPTKGDTVPYTSQAIGDTVKIRLRDDLGNQLYNMVYSLSDTVKNASIWTNWFHGLCLSAAATAPAGSTGAIYGFKDSAIMRIYYREAGIISSEKFIDFNVTNRSLAFNSIRTNYANTPLQNLQKPTQSVQPPPATLSKLTGNAAYVQPITGLNVKISFPNLKAIALRPDYIGLLRATLTIRPVPGSFNTEWRLPPSLGIYATDQNNQLGVPIPGAGIAGAQTGNLSLNYFAPLTTAYTYDVTAFIKQQITNNASNAADQGLILSAPAPANVADFRRVVLADQTYQVSQRVLLNVYYISLFPHN